MLRIFKKNIFISHSSGNAIIAEQLGALLKKFGVSNDRIFCSSVLGQGVNNGEKLNESIFQAIKGAKIVIYILSQDFLSSNYCIEELGAGWYLSNNKQTNCYFLRIPDIELSQLHGFVNSKIDKFSLLNNPDDLTLLIENICNTLRINTPKASEIASNIRSFLSAINDECNKCIEKKTQAEKLERERLIRVAQLEGELASINRLINDYKDKLLLERKRSNEDILKSELEILDKYIGPLSYITCISSLDIQNLNQKGFWYRIINEYTEILNKLGMEHYTYHMERLIAQIFVAYGNFTKGYKHFKYAIQNYNYDIGMYFHNIDRFTNEYPYSLSEIIELLKEKEKIQPEGVTKDAVNKCIQELEKREASIVAATN